MKPIGVRESDIAAVRNSGLFDAAWYLAQYPDVEALGLDPVVHYLWVGAHLGRKPSPRFDGQTYLAANPDVAITGINPLVHYATIGIAEARVGASGSYYKSSDRPATSHSAAGSSSEPIPDGRIHRIVCASNGVELPDLFHLRASVPATSRLIVADVPNEEAMKRLRTTLNRLQFDFDLIFTQPMHQSSIETIDAQGRCRKQAVVVYPDRFGPAQVFLHLANSNAVSKYEKICWIDSGIGIDHDAGDRISALWSHDGRKHFGLVGTVLSSPPESLKLSISRLLTTFAARLGRKPPASVERCATGAIVMIAPLLLHQLRSYQIQVAELASGGDPKWVLASVLAMICDEASLSKCTLSAAIAETGSGTTRASSSDRQVKAIAFYLPQFHPIPENDLWWGEGFTEWTNVAKARPVFRSHYQPCLPADLGFYDLRTPETQMAQAELAQANGIHGFCYYYYWFGGKKLLNRPIEQMIRSGTPDFPFCVCWANENWSRNWDGQNRHVLVEQSYDMDSNRALIREFIAMMRDPRYIRHDGKPVLLVYRIRIIPNWLETAAMWRDECRRAGIGEIHLCAVRFGLEPLDGDPSEFGVDAYAMFPPHESERVDARNDVLDLKAGFNGTIFSYDAVIEGDITRFSEGYPWPVHRGLMLGWDNTARRPHDSRIFLGATPARFHHWLNAIVAQDDRHKPGEESLVFINAWNEWAEGTTLEPSTRFGRGYLEAVRTTLHGRVSKTKNLHSKTLLSDGSRMASDVAAAPVQSYEGSRARLPEAPTVLVCAHVVSDRMYGGERSFLDILDALAQIELNILVALPSGNHAFYTKLVQERSVGVFVLPYSQWRNNREPDEDLTQAFCNLIEEQDIDVVYANTIVLLEPLLAAQQTGRIPVVHARELITHDIELAEQIGLPPDEIVRRVFGNCSYVVANSRATEKLFYRESTTFLAPNIVNPQVFDIPNELGETITFGIVSSNLPKKGVIDFIEVARLCERTAPTARFLVIGPENDHVEQWKVDAPSNLSFAGYSETPQSAMAQINVLLSLSHFAESFGRTVAEALAARRPVVAYDWGAVPELVEHSVTGFLAPYRDIEKVAHYVARLCGEPQLIETMGTAGRDAISRSNAPSVLRDNLWEAFQRILDRKIEKRIDKRPVTIIVPVHNAHDDVVRCLSSLTENVDFSRARVLVIDDASTDERIPGLLAEHCKHAGFNLLSNERNIGYTGTINRGIRWAGDDDVVLLNSDTVLVPGWLDGLTRTAFHQANVGTVTAMSDNAGAFSFPVINKPNPKPAGVSHANYAAAILRATSTCGPVEVPTGSGFCMYIRREVFDRIGLFDAETFPRGYGEENDFCMRVLSAGWKNFITPYSFVFHARSASFGQEKEQLIERAVGAVTSRYPDYASRVKLAFSSAEMNELREAANKGLQQANILT